MRLSKLKYHLPKELIAQYPLEDRAASRLLVLNRRTGIITHASFRKICTFFKKGDVLVLNNTKVFKARLQGKKKTGGVVEILLLGKKTDHVWISMISHAKRVHVGTKIYFTPETYATIKEKTGSRCLIEFNIPVERVVETLGTVPLPKYIKRESSEKDEEKYQTVYAKKQGSVAAPTAGLHFTDEVLQSIQDRGADIVEITLHIGPGTFRPIRTEHIEDHVMDAEVYEVSNTSITAIRNAQNVVAIGTSVCRALETWAQTGKACGFASLFIYPGYRFNIINALVTNLHLPCSTPLALVSAFAGRNTILTAYKEAVHQKYRFLSYGDAMLIL